MLLEDTLELHEGQNQEREKHGIQEMRSNRKANGKPERMRRKCVSRQVLRKITLDDGRIWKATGGCIHWGWRREGNSMRLLDEFDAIGRSFRVYWQV